MFLLINCLAAYINVYNSLLFNFVPLFFYSVFNYQEVQIIQFEELQNTSNKKNWKENYAENLYENEF